MHTYFRAQSKGFDFAAMQSHISADGGDGLGTEGGLCAAYSVSDLLANTVMQAMDADDEVIAIRGISIIEIYDGYRIIPVEEVHRWTVADFKANSDQIAWDYED